MSSYLVDSEISVLRDLMVVSSIRGMWGSGIITVPQSQKLPIKWYKSEGSGATIMYHKDTKEMMKARLSAIVGHCRYPTTGGDKLDDSHPHASGHIIGTHNGTMEIVNGYKVGNTDNDSILLFDSFRKNGVHETISKSRGSYALVWVDTKTQTLNFLRNKHRPLFFGYPGDFKQTVFWASEHCFLDMCITRKYQIGTKVTISMLPEDTWISVPLHFKNAVQIKSSEEVKSLPPKKPDKTVADMGWEELLDQYDASMLGPDSQVPTQDLFETSKNKFVPTAELEAILSAGCAVCNESSTREEYDNDDLHFIPPESPQSTSLFVCKKCYEDEKSYAKAWADGEYMDAAKLNTKHEHLH